MSNSKPRITIKAALLSAGLLFAPLGMIAAQQVAKKNASK
jgi:hypothetical protein